MDHIGLFCTNSVYHEKDCCDAERPITYLIFNFYNNYSFCISCIPSFVFWSVMIIVSIIDD